MQRLSRHGSRAPGDRRDRAGPRRAAPGGAACQRQQRFVRESAARGLSARMPRVRARRRARVARRAHAWRSSMRAQAGDAEGEAHALSGLADVLYAEGRMRSSLAAFEQCLALCDRLGLARYLAEQPVHARRRALPISSRPTVRSASSIACESLARQLHHRAAEVMADESEGWVRVAQGRYCGRARADGAQPRARP